MLLPLKLARDGPLQQQLYEQLAGLITSGRLPNGTRMPSTRLLADQFSISRMTVLLTYERLIAEGSLRTERARGTFVHHQAARPGPDATLRQFPAGAEEADCDAGRPDHRLFPLNRWRALIRHALDDLGPRLARQQPDDDPALRRSIAGWVARSRGFHVDPDQVVLANDPCHAMHIVTHIYLRPGSRLVVEQPCAPELDRLLAGSGAAVLRVPVDRDGLRSKSLPPGPFDLALVSPESHNPSGARLSQAHRAALLAWAGRSGAVIVACDFEGDLRYAPDEAAPLFGNTAGVPVIHASGFAASLGPGTLCSYLIVPADMVPAARAASRIIGLSHATLDAAALARMLDEGLYARHLHGVRKIYQGRRDALIRSLRSEVGGEPFAVPAAGLRLAWICPPERPVSSGMAMMARRRGLAVTRTQDGLLYLGFGARNERELAAAVACLGSSTIPVAAEAGN